MTINRLFHCNNPECHDTRNTMSTPELFQRDDKSAVISSDGLYRYELWRHWSNAGTAVFIGLNPSTADATKDDPTIRKCVGFSKRWGFGALCMVNLFALRATRPKDMMKAELPSGMDNQHHLLKCTSEAGIVIAAWGANGSFQNQDLTVFQWLQQAGVSLHALRLNTDGSPGHPLYIPYEAKPFPFIS